MPTDAQNSWNVEFDNWVDTALLQDLRQAFRAAWVARGNYDANLFPGYYAATRPSRFNDGTTIGFQTIAQVIHTIDPDPTTR